MGSHLDTVPQGGKFDGMLGVLAGLECVRTIREHGIDLPWNLEVINFTDEEAAHNAGTVGSRAMLGQLEGRGAREEREGRVGPRSPRICARAGKDPRGSARRAAIPRSSPGTWSCTSNRVARLESEGVQIGAVTAIVGIYRYLVTVEGEASHAGTTPMALRDDALVKAAPVFTLLPEWVRERNPEMVGTIGQVELHPGATNVVPGRCKFVVEVRSQEKADMVHIREVLKGYVAEREGWRVETILEKDGHSVRRASHPGGAETAAAAEGLSCIRMPSGAGHDAQSFAAAGVPTGMIFVPCRRGMSHSPEEWIEPAQAAQGCQVLLRSLAEPGGSRVGGH